MESDKYRFLDIGGGGDWGGGIFYTPTLIEEIDNLRGVRLAEENPGNEYVIFDANISIPRVAHRVAQKAQEIPNLHIVIGRIAITQYLPFKDVSMDRVEMSHMYTPL